MSAGSTSAPELPDANLMSQVAAGDADAFALVFDRHSPAALGLLIQMLHRRAEAEEILQEVFLQVWRRAGDYDPGRASLRGWILVLARSRALDRVRSRRARLGREAATVEDRERLRGGRDAEPVGTARLEARERSRQMFAALGELPEAQRRAVELAFFEGLTHSQIAQRVQAPLGTVKSRVLLGMKKLRHALGKHRSPGGQETSP